MNGRSEPTKEIWADPARSAHVPTAVGSWNFGSKLVANSADFADFSDSAGL
jgi:hypothetical protein